MSDQKSQPNEGFTSLLVPMTHRPVCHHSPAWSGLLACVDMLCVCEVNRVDCMSLSFSLQCLRQTAPVCSDLQFLRAKGPEGSHNFKIYVCILGKEKLNGFMWKECSPPSPVFYLHLPSLWFFNFSPDSSIAASFLCSPCSPCYLHLCSPCAVRSVLSHIFPSNLSFAFASFLSEQDCDFKCSLTVVTVHFCSAHFLKLLK